MCVRHSVPGRVLPWSAGRQQSHRLRQDMLAVPGMHRRIVIGVEHNGRDSPARCSHHCPARGLASRSGSPLSHGGEGRGDVAGGTTGEAGMYPDGCVEIAATSLSNSVMRQASGAAASLRRCSGRLRSWALCQRQFGVLLRAHRAALAKRGFRSGYRQGRSRRLGPHPIARPYRAASGCGWHSTLLSGWRSRSPPISPMTRAGHRAPPHPGAPSGPALDAAHQPAPRMVVLRRRVRTFADAEVLVVR